MSPGPSEFYPQVAIVGAGRTGRGFVGRLLVDHDVPFILIDADRGIVGKLRMPDGYRVDFFTGRQDIVCRHNGAFHTSDPKLSEMWSGIEVVFVSVGASRLEELGRWLAALVPGLAPVPVVLCENAIDPAASVRRGAESAGISSMDFAERYVLLPAAVFCTTVEPVAGKTDIVSEEYDRLEYSAHAAVQISEKLPFLFPRDDFDLLIRRKIYTYNAASAVIAYLGWWMEHETLAEAVADPRVAGILDAAYGEINRAISAGYGVEMAEQEAFATRSLKKFANPLIVDSVERNAREPLRKLGRNERIIAPALLVLEQGGDTSPFELTAALALLYSSEVEKSDIQGNFDGWRSVLTRVTSLPAGHPLVERIVSMCGSFEEAGRNHLPLG